MWHVWYSTKVCELVCQHHCVWEQVPRRILGTTRRLEKNLHNEKPYNMLCSGRHHDDQMRLFFFGKMKCAKVFSDLDVDGEMTYKWTVTMCQTIRKQQRCRFTCHEGVCGVEVELHLFSTSAVDGDKLRASHPGRFSSPSLGKEKRALVDILYRCRESNDDSSVVQPVCTDCVIATSLVSRVWPGIITSECGPVSGS